jgi:Putative adhesin
VDPFRARIENLLRQGKITPEEANKLLRALETPGETTSESLTGSTPVAPPKPQPVTVPPTPEPVPVTPPPAPKPVAPPPAPPRPPAPPPAPPTAVTSTKLEGPFTGLFLNVNAGDIDVRGVPGNTLEATVQNGTLEVTNTNGNVRITAHGRIDDPTEIGWLNTVIKTIGRALPVQLQISVPETLGDLEINALAGDVDVRGVKGHVKLDLKAGDLKLEDATSFDVNGKAGDIKIRTKLENGTSRVNAIAGDVDVTLTPGSSVALKASISAGDVSAKGFILTQSEKRVVGGSLEGRLGAGRASLECRLAAGDLDIVAVDGDKQ